MPRPDCGCPLGLSVCPLQIPPRGVPNRGRPRLGRAQLGHHPAGPGARAWKHHPTQTSRLPVSPAQHVFTSPPQPPAAAPRDLPWLAPYSLNLTAGTTAHPASREVSLTPHLNLSSPHVSIEPPAQYVCDFVGEVHRDEEFESGQRSDEYAFNMRFAENRSWEGGISDDWEHVRFLCLCCAGTKSHCGARPWCVVTCVDGVIASHRRCRLNYSPAQQDEDLAHDNKYVLDATRFGTVARFVNHSCEPNLFIQPVLTHHRDKDMPRICLYTMETVPALTELTCALLPLRRGGSCLNELSSATSESKRPSRAFRRDNSPAGLPAVRLRHHRTAIAPLTLLFTFPPSSLFWQVRLWPAVR